MPTFVAIYDVEPDEFDYRDDGVTDEAGDLADNVHRFLRQDLGKNPSGVATVVNPSFHKRLETAWEDAERGEQEGRTFIVHPDGTGEIYNLQRIEESDLPEFFGQFTLPEDDSWLDVAGRWVFYDATHLSEAEIERILETHNEDCERILEFGDFIGFTPFIRNSLSTGGCGE